MWEMKVSIKWRQRRSPPDAQGSLAGVCGDGKKGRQTVQISAAQEQALTECTKNSRPLDFILKFTKKISILITFQQVAKDTSYRY